MSDLLLDTHLDPDQRECVENVGRSANSLLTVINDVSHRSQALLCEEMY